jgi:Rieske Fe-S protein|tara:strand:+ start:226 stop:495 length:270 start_codon:yes stop_codon:yes gene_type:complete
MEKLRKMTKKEVDKLRSKGEILEDKTLGDRLRTIYKFFDKQYNDGYSYVCVWCGDFVENRDNIVIFCADCYHLKCISKVYESERETRDL